MTFHVEMGRLDEFERRTREPADQTSDWSNIRSAERRHDLYDLSYTRGKRTADAASCPSSAPRRPVNGDQASADSPQSRDGYIESTCCRLRTMVELDGIELAAVHRIAS